MAVLISLLRGVNVGGHNLIKMEALRAVFASLGFEDCQTYVQSGNVVFRAGSPKGAPGGERQMAPLARRLEDALERRFGFRPDVILRTAAELREVVERNPFAKRREIVPAKLQVAFLARQPGADAGRQLRALEIHPEELHLDGREIYIHYPNGMGRARLSGPVMDRILKIPLTCRNWNTVSKLLEIAEGIEAGRPSSESVIQ